MGRARDTARCRQLGQEIRNEPFDLVKEEIVRRLRHNIRGRTYALT